MELNFWKKRETPFLVLDIGTESVKSLIIKKSKSKLNILGSSAVYFEKSGVFDKSFNQQEFEMEITKRAILKSLQEASSEAILKTSNPPALICLPPNVLRAKIVDFKTSRKNKELKISKREKEDICSSALNSSQEKIIKDASLATGLVPKEIKIIFSAFLEKKIDGYSVGRIEKCQGENISLKIIIVYALNFYLEGIEKIFNSLNINVLKIVHLAEAIPVYFKNIESGIFCDVGGEISQMFFLKKGVLEKIKYINKGGKDLTQIISDNLGVSETEARDLKEKYAKGLLSDQAFLRIKEMLLPQTSKLKSSFMESGNFRTFFFGGSGPLLSKNLLLPQNFKNIDDSTKKIKSCQFVPAILISQKLYEQKNI